jgi:hypothetical protein
MVLNLYTSLTQQLLQNPPAPTTLYSIAIVQQYINIARSQIAGESESIRYQATQSTAIGVRNYAFSGFSTGVANGIAGVLHARRVMYGVGAGYKWIPPREWEWFELYHLNNPVPVNGAPARWAQYASGTSGNIYLDPPPDAIYAMSIDTVCYPINLALDTDPEALSYPFTDCIPFLASYYILLTSQTSARLAQAQQYYQFYEEFMKRGRQMANPSVLRHQYEQSTDVVLANKLGLKAGG